MSLAFLIQRSLSRYNITMNTQATKPSQWTFDDVSQIKQQIKQELDAIELSEKLDHIGRRISELEYEANPISALKRFVYVMSALVHHQRHGGLAGAQLKNLIDLAETILRVEKIDPLKSKLAGLYSELHLALSQIFRKNGEHLSAAWEQQLSCLYARHQPADWIEFQNLALAHRSLRLGDPQTALENFAHVEESELPAIQKENARLGRIKCLRLAGDLRGAHDLIEITKKDSAGMSQDSKIELEWEKICLGVQQGENLGSMMKAIRKGGAHYSAAYVLEGYLWARSHKDKMWFSEMPKLSYVARDKDLGLRHQGMLYGALSRLETSDDEGIPLPLRLRSLGEIISQISQVVLVESELLIFAALARWFSRKRLMGLKKFTAGEYQKLSRTLTQGEQDDVLNLLTGLTA